MSLYGSVVPTVFVIFAVAASQKLFKLIEFDLTRTVFIYLVDERLDINSHLKLLLDGLYQLVGIDATTSVLVSAHGDVSIKKVVVRRSALVFALFHDNLFELVEAELACIVWIRLGNHAENLLLTDALIKLLERLLELICSNNALLLYIILHETLPDLVAFLALALFFLPFSVFRG